MEVAPSLPLTLRACPLRIMAKEDFHSSQQVTFSSVHGEAAAINADEVILDERDTDIRKDAMRAASTCREEQQYNFGNGAVPSLAYHLSYPYPTPNPNARISVNEENPATVSSAAPRSPPLSVVTNNMRLERSADALLSLPDKHGQSGFCTDKPSAPSPAFSSGNQCQASSPARKPRAFSPLKQAQCVSPSSAIQFQASSLLVACSPVKQLQAFSPPSQSQAFLPSRQASPPKEFEASQLQASSPLEHSQASSPAKYFPSFPSTDQTGAFALLSSPLHRQQASSPLSRPYAEGSLPGKQAKVVLESSSAQLSPPAIQGNSKKRPRSSAVRDFPEGCGKNVFANANIAIKQARKEQKLGAGGEALPHPRRPVLMMKDESALCLYDSQKMSTPLLKTPRAHVPLKWKHEARSPTDRKKPKVRCLSHMLSSAEERTFQLEWLKEGEYEHFASPERPVMLQGGSGLKIRLSMRSNGSIPAERLPQPVEGLENLLSIEGNCGASARSLVKRTLQEFDCVRRSLAMTKDHHQRPDLAAARILRSKGMWRNYGERKIVGDVPGVEVGDQFSFRIAMLIIGLHRQVQGGIDYISGTVRGKGPLAVSIVASGGYEDDDDCGATFIYTGQGGNNYKGDRRQARDQVLKRGNLALSNSFKEKSPVRVIRGSTDDKLYTYDGLYDVVDCWFQTGASGFGVFQVKLSRRPGQPELVSYLVKFMGTAKRKGLARPHLLLADISVGKERLPICVVNEVDDELAPLFTYVQKMKYPSWCHPELSRGCDCVGGCVDASKCLCAAKNGGDFPYNEYGQIVRGKKVVFECGKSCACPSSCYNRVSQKGPTSKLEVFKTKRRGWGVRSWDSIRPGGFICEYVGELLSDSDAERRTGCDEYLFDIGNMMSWSDASGLMDTSKEEAIVPVVEDAGFTIDARLFGNVARFINHSCSPNLFAQNVVYDNDDLRFPHVMLFSMENIPPMRELSYDYNYTIGHVRDANGNVKCKACYCGAQDCRGRLY